MSLSSYLARYAETETAAAADLQGNWQLALCIPAYRESPAFLERLAAFATPDQVLCLLAVNAPENADESGLAATRELLRAACSRPLLARIRPWLSLHRLQEHMDLLVFDNCTPGRLLPARQGVGLARKTLCDLACALMAAGKVSRPWLFSTDADAHLPAAYFNVINQNSAADSACLIYPFRHLPAADPVLHLAQRLYDFSLHYYVAGLRYAGSPWAFHTIGSTLAIHAEAYARVRGFPRRNAAEDFYMLNKLAKVGPVLSLAAPVLELDSRCSDRVPFGTGVAVAAIARMQQPLAEFHCYDPDVFECLQRWLQVLPRLWSQAARLEPGLLPDLEQRCAVVLCEILDSMGLPQALLHARQHGKTESAFQKHMHGWFDAFRTLKLIHALRDRLLPSVPVMDAKFAGTLPRLDEDLFTQWQELTGWQGLDGPA